MNKAEAYVGPFYYINGRVYSDMVLIKGAQKYGEFMTWGSHYDFWDSLCSKNPAFKELEYNHYPRGRVTYNYTSKTFYVYINPKLNEEKILSSIIDKFNLRDYNYIVDDSDEHYQY